MLCRAALGFAYFVAVARGFLTRTCLPVAAVTNFTALTLFYFEMFWRLREWMPLRKRSPFEQRLSRAQDGYLFARVPAVTDGP